MYVPVSNIVKRAIAMKGAIRQGSTAEPAEAAAQPRAAERILAVARDLFYRVGIRAVGVDEIVRQAGVTKPSLYRSFASKDELAASYLRVYELEFWARFDKAVSQHPGDPRKQIVAFLSGVGHRAVKPDYRGCGMTNAAVEYPEASHPARQVGEANKRELRRRLRAWRRRWARPIPTRWATGCCC